MNNLNIGDTIVVDETRTGNRQLESTFTNSWRPLMEDNSNEWTVLESEQGDLAKITNRFTTRATRMNGYSYTTGYEFRCIRRSPNSYFLGRKIYSS